MAPLAWYKVSIVMSLEYHANIAYNDPYLKRRKRRRIVLILVIILIGGLLAAGIAYAIPRIEARVPERDTEVPKSRILELWQIRDYASVLSACDHSLQLDPLDSFYLAFKGFALFYAGMAEPDTDLRVSLIDDSIFSLRRSLIDGEPELRADTLYILGKAYYHKGSDYHDNAMANLEAAIDAGSKATDLWEYMALASYQSGMVERSVDYFAQAVAISPGSAELLLAAALANFEAGNLSRAEGLAIDAAEMASDAYLKEKCMFLLGDIYRNTGRLAEALQQYETVKTNNPESADAWYYEGLVYQQLDEAVKARASWRRAVVIDPMHPGARQKLAER
jgi:tetratricopeptide (TPR) repeat protein